MPPPPLVTVITAVRDGARFLSEAISSVRAQTLGDWELIVVDDASSDATPDIVEGAARTDARIRLLRRDTNAGPYVAANDGIAVARGTYIARLDADDLALPDRFEAQVDFLRSRPELRACGGYHQSVDEEGRILRDIGRITLLPGPMRWRLSVAGGPVHSTAMVEREAFNEIGGYRPLRAAQDWRMWCDLSRRGWLGVIPQVVAHRRLHGGQITETARPLQVQLSLDVIRDHLAEISGETWSLKDIELLWLTGHAFAEAPLRKGIAVLARWTALWQRDTTLTQPERDQLALWTRKLRSRHISRWLEKRPVAARVSAVVLSVRNTVRPSAARPTRDEDRSAVE